jgi:hypothetical protein
MATVPVELLAQEQATVRKLLILFGPWWPHYTPPYVLRWTLFAERTACPYCDGALGTEPGGDGDDLDRAHLDHMDPLSRGGEESVRNAIYVCASCNMAKGNRLFVDWLASLPEHRRASVRQIYVARQGRPPEQFTPGPRQPRMLLTRPELAFDESVLRRLFPKPLVGGPPRRNTNESDA